MARNNWNSYNHDEIGSWPATFKDPKMRDPKLVLDFVARVLEAGERERVLMVKELEHHRFPYHESMGISFIQHMDNVFKQHGEILFPDGFQTVSYICYYDSDGELTQGDIDNMGALLLDVEIIEPGSSRDYCSWPPLIINYDYIPSPEKYKSYNGIIFRFEIYTKTDIWKPELWYTNDDNLELAMCHTPRLNRFLAEFKRLTLEFGGEWGYPEWADYDGDAIPLP